MAFFSKKEDSNKDKLATLIAQGLTLSKDNQPQKAIGFFKEALKIKPDSPTILANIGIMHKELKEYDKAVELLNKALKIDSKDKDELKKHQILHNLALVYAKMEDWEKAKSYAQKTIEEKPEYVAAYKLLAGIYFEQKDYQKTVEYCDKALKMDPNDQMLLKVKEVAKNQF